MITFSRKRLFVFGLAVASLSPLGQAGFARADGPTTTPAAAPSANADAALAKADHQIAAALAYLASHQNADGSWGAPNDPPAISALALRAFARNGQNHDAAVAKGYDWLIGFQKPDGGIYRDTLANYNTSIAISALFAGDPVKYKDAIDKAVGYVRNIQFGATGEADPNDAFYGGWGYGTAPAGRKDRPDLSNAQVALDALHDACVPSNDPAYQRALAFLSRCQNLKASNPSKWASNDGGFAYGPGADKNGDSEAGEYTGPDGQRMVRSYGSMTYAGLKSMIYAGLTKEDPRVKAAVEWIGRNYTLDKNPGMELSDPSMAKAGLYYYFETIGRAMAARGEPTLPLADGRSVDWRIDLIDKLGTLQQADGSWVGERRWMESNPVLVTAYGVQALEEARDELKRTSAR